MEGWYGLEGQKEEILPRQGSNKINLSRGRSITPENISDKTFPSPHKGSEGEEKCI